MNASNVDEAVVEDFGAEWERFDQSSISEAELREQFDDYFDVFPWDALADDAVGCDFGCGSGRWARFAAPRVGHLHCLDPSDAIEVARRNLASHTNCTFHHATIDACAIEDTSLDFGYSLGVLHHIPDTLEAMRSCTRKLKPGAPFLVYLYYRFDNRPSWYQRVWKASDYVRRGISRLPPRAKHLTCEYIAATVYWPLARSAKAVERVGLDPTLIPLSSYRDKDFYWMRTDALDRFGTKLEQRFTRDEIAAMMEASGLERVTFSETAPFWGAVGFKKSA